MWGECPSRNTTARITPRMCSSGQTPSRILCGRPRPFGRRSTKRRKISAGMGRSEEEVFISLQIGSARKFLRRSRPAPRYKNALKAKMLYDV
ncbi:hypothetical protein PUN28_009183 [Cardiocondyla obscurior]|uniref:Uncharacterized protein n=1 Tax=Cardiocondyla obscurior TaxID=286306 RepID=A0AAW2FT82_9HYME